MVYIQQSNDIECRIPTCLVFSADKNAVVYSKGNVEQRVAGGLGFPILIYHLLLNIHKGNIAWTDMVQVNGYAANESGHINSLGLARGQEVNLFTLFCAAVSCGAPDAIVAIGGHIFNTIGQGKNKTVARLKKIGNQWGLSSDCVKNLSGRNYEENPQHFSTADLLMVAKQLLSFDVENYLGYNAVAFDGKFLKCRGVLGSNQSITRYFCFGEKDNLHAIAMVETMNETLFAVVCGARDLLERDAEMYHAIHCAVVGTCESGQVVTGEWTNVSKNILTIYGDTYCGERYTKWRIKRNIDDPMQRYGDEGYTFSFEKVAPFLSKDSFNVVNSECVLSPVFDESQQTGKYIDFVLGANPAKTVACYKQVNIDAVLLANNHMMDFGAAGCRQTKKYFEEAGIFTAGTGSNIDEAEKPICLNMNGRKVIIFNAYGFFLEKRYKLFQHYCLGNNTGAAFITDKLDECPIFERISAYRGMYPDAFLILSPHWSTDFNEAHLHLRSIARKAFEAGIDFIAGHGPHIPIGVERVVGKIVVYSLGNFVFNTTGVDLDASGQLPYGVISRLHFDDDVVKLCLYPVYTHNLNTFFQPRPVNEEQFNEFLRGFIGENKFCKTQDALGYCLEMSIT